MRPLAKQILKVFRTMDAINFEDLMYGRNEWRNIQDIIRKALLSAFRSLEEQSQRILTTHTEIETENRVSQEKLATFATRDEIKSALSTKLSVKDFQAFIEQKQSLPAQPSEEILAVLEKHAAEINDLRQQLASKASAEEVPRLKASIEDVNKMSQEKANKQSVIAALQRKANREELDEIRTQLQKATSERCPQCSATGGTAATLCGSSKGRSSVCPTAAAAAGDVFLLEEKLESLKLEMKELSTRLHADISAHENYLKALDTHMSTVTTALDTRSTSTAMDALNARVAELRLSIEECKRDCSSKGDVAALKTELLGHLSQSLQSCAKSVDLNALHMEVRKKVDSEQLSSIMASSSPIPELVSLREDVKRKADSLDLASALATKASVSELDSLHTFVREHLGAMQEDLSRKASVVDVAELRSSFLSSASATDLRSELMNLLRLQEQQVRGDLKRVTKSVLDALERAKELGHVKTSDADQDAEAALKFGVPSVRSFGRDLDRVERKLETLTSVCPCVGRWVWNSGRLKSGHGVPWNREVQNTQPDVIVWQLDHANIQVASSGLYRVSFGFFSWKLPVVQIHVDGAPVISTIGPPPNITYHTPGKFTGVESRPKMAGLTHVDFLFLPENSKLALSYSGDENARGFLELEKIS